MLLPLEMRVRPFLLRGQVEPYPEEEEVGDRIAKEREAPVQVLDDDKGWVTAIHCVRMELGEPDASGRRRPQPKKGSEFIMDIDTVAVSLGTSPNPLIASTTPDLQVTKWGTVIADDPLLTDRSGLPRRRPLQRVILDSRLRLPLESRVVKTVRADVLVICSFAEEKKRRQLEEHGVRVKLQDQPLAVLCVLLEHPGDVVPRDEIRQRIWPADTFDAVPKTVL